MDKVSIILPTYNVESYLDKCLESICKQTYKDMEIIVVIDGATDNSLNIANQWCKKDDRIIVVEQENAGSGPARNHGLSLATGTYVMFVDPDDWIEQEMLETLMREIKKANADFLTTGCSSDYYDTNGMLYKTELDCFKTEYLMDAHSVHQKYVELLLMGGAGAPTKKIYKMEIIKEHHILFPDLRRSQDIVFNYRYIDCIQSMIIYDSNFYHYRIEEETYQKKIHIHYYKTVCLLYSEIRELLKKWNVILSKEEEQNFIQYFYNLIVWQISIGDSNSIMKDLVNQDVILEIVSNSKPKGLKQILLNFLIIHKQFKIINWVMSILKK